MRDKQRLGSSITKIEKEDRLTTLLAPHAFIKCRTNLEIKISGHLRELTSIQKLDVISSATSMDVKLQLLSYFGWDT